MTRRRKKRRKSRRKRKRKTKKRRVSPRTNDQILIIQRIQIIWRSIWNLAKSMVAGRNVQNIIYQIMNSQSIQFARDQQEQVIEIANSPIKHILFYSNSLRRQKTIITTENGFCIINNATKTYRRFQNQDNPFFKKNQKTVAIKMGHILEQRNEVALVPAENTKHFSKTAVYIFEYQLKTILYQNDFFLPIRQLTFTQESLIISNNKRIIIYDYINDNKQKDQKFYLDLFKKNEPNNQLRYFEMHCQEKFANNAFNDCQEEELGMEEFCKCGTYVISGKKPYKMVYVRVYSINNAKRISLMIYDWALDKQYSFQSFPFQQPFNFTISEEGDFLTYSQNYGKSMKVYDLINNKLYCQLWVSRSIKNVVCHGFFRIDDSLWYTVTRKDGNHGNMHLFKIVQKPPGNYIESQFKRYFSLYEKTFKDYQIASRMIGPDFYVHNGTVYSYSLSGIVHDVIDMKRSGNHSKKNVQNFVKWTDHEAQTQKSNIMLDIKSKLFT